MTNSKSINKLGLVVAVLVALCGSALADKRKRIVVLPFDGDEKSAEKIHAAVVKLLKKSHTVLTAEKWESAAEKLSATKVTDKNIKKVATKLKVDGIVEGKVDKRRDTYIIKLKLRSGSTGGVSTKVDTSADSVKLDGDATKDIKGELLPGIDELDAVRGGGDDEEEEVKPTKKKPAKDDEEEEEVKPAKKPGKDDKKKKPVKDDEEEETKPVAKKPGKDDKKKKPAKDDEDEKPAKASKFGGGQMKKDDEGAALKSKKDEEEDPLPSKKRPAKKDDEEETKDVAKKDDGEEIEESVTPGVKMDAALALSPGNRAIDATFGLSLNARRLSWKTAGDLGPSMGVMGQGKPPNYKGTPAPGAVLDITAYPLAFGHKSDGMLKNIGLTVLYDQALLISSEAGGQKKDTKASRYAVGAVFRYPLGKSATAPVVGGSVTYGGQKFQIAGPVDLPNVNYSMISPGVFFHYPLSEKMVLSTGVSYMLISKTGQMTKADGNGYGKGTVSGIDAEIGGDYLVTKSIFARAAVKLETIGYKFGNNAGTLATDRDADPEQDVFGARDTYIGAAVTVGYLY